MCDRVHSPIIRFYFISLVRMPSDAPSGRKKRDCSRTMNVLEFLMHRRTDECNFFLSEQIVLLTGNNLITKVVNLFEY
jgi:hypothetical protein